MAKTNPNKPQLSGAQLNYMISALSRTAGDLQRDIKMAKKFSGHFWKFSEKGTPEGEEAFAQLNAARTATRQMKQQLKRINDLIVVLKGQRRGTP